MMSCRKIQYLIQSYADGEASTSERETVDLHVAGCSACAEELDASQQLMGALTGMPERRVSDGFERSLMAAIAETRPVSTPAAWWERFRVRFEWRLRVPALVTAGSLAAAIIAAVATPGIQDVVIAGREAKRERQEYVATAVERYKQLNRADSRADGQVNWDAMEASIELNTGSVVTE